MGRDEQYFDEMALVIVTARRILGKVAERLAEGGDDGDDGDVPVLNDINQWLTDAHRVVPNRAKA